REEGAEQPAWSAGSPGRAQMLQRDFGDAAPQGVRRPFRRQAHTQLPLERIMFCHVCTHPCRASASRNSRLARTSNASNAFTDMSKALAASVFFSPAV